MPPTPQRAKPKTQAQVIAGFRQAIATSKDHISDGDFYNAVVQAMLDAGWDDAGQITFPKPSDHGCRFSKPNSPLRPTVCRADFMGVFTDLQFKSGL